MFVGHYAAAFAAKAVEPKAPMWTLAAGCQLIDFGWAAFIMTGVEHANSDPGLPGSPYVLYDMPWTHSLPAALTWSIGAALLVKLLLRLPNWASVVVGLTVFSHWVLDLLVHRPDLQLYPDGPKIGFALWNYPVAEEAIEIGLIAVCGGMWIASRKSLGRSAWPAVALMTGLVALQILVLFLPKEDGPVSFQGGLNALIVYVIVTVLLGLTDLGGKKKGEA
jgi:hypothetical protein